MHKNQLHLDSSKNGLSISQQTNSVKKMLLTQNNQEGVRPYIHPIVLPGHTQELTQDSPSHHPWQHGLYFAFHDVNGSDFWLDSGNAVGHYSKNKTEIITQEPQFIRWQTSCTGVHHEGDPLFEEKTTWSFTCEQDKIYLHASYQLKAIQGLIIGQCQYGGLFLRMPWEKDLDVFVENSEGDLGLNTEQKTAEWLDMRFNFGKENHQQFGVLITQHPKENAKPAPWRVDKKYGVGPSEVINGPLTIKNQDILQLEYSLVFYAGTLEPKTRSFILNNLTEKSTCQKM